MPLSFEANRGQTDPQVDFLARGSGYSLFLTTGEAIFNLRASAADDGGPAGAVPRMQLVGANAGAHADGLQQLPGVANYFPGNDPSGWRTDIPTYARVAYAGVYPGVDLIYYGNQGQLEYDFVVAPGADPGAIRLALAGADTLELDGGADLVPRLAGGEVRLRAPVVYQEVDGGRQVIDGGDAPDDEGGDDCRGQADTDTATNCEQTGSVP